MTAFDEKDLHVVVARAGYGAPVHVDITHLPTGLSASAVHRDERRARKEAMDRLRHVIAELAPDAAKEPQ
jgi:protein subunit release factor A